MTEPSNDQAEAAASGGDQIRPPHFAEVERHLDRVARRLLDEELAAKEADEKDDPPPTDPVRRPPRFAEVERVLDEFARELLAEKLERPDRGEES